MSWDYPDHNNIAHAITTYKLFPITTLTSLTLEQKRSLIKQGFVLCKDIHRYIPLLRSLIIPEDAITTIIHEAEGVCL